MEEARSLRRIIFMSACALGVVVLAAFALRHWVLRPRSAGAAEPEYSAYDTAKDLSETTRANWGRSQYLVPSEVPPGAAEKEEVIPFDGFAVSVDSTPDGATVRCKGKELGSTPVAAGIDCTPGEEVRIEIERKPFRPVVKTTLCRKDALVKIAVALGR